LLNIEDGGSRASHLCTPKARAVLMASKYRKVMAALTQIELEARKRKDERTQKVFRAIIQAYKMTARRIKKVYGQEAFLEWGEWLYRISPFDENLAEPSNAQKSSRSPPLYPG
jgi:hypothetical protein